MVPTVCVTTFFKRKWASEYLFTKTSVSLCGFKKAYHKLQVRSEAKTSKAFRAASDIFRHNMLHFPGLAQNQSEDEVCVYRIKICVIFTRSAQMVSLSFKSFAIGH